MFFLVFTTLGNPCCDEDAVLPDETEAVACSESYCLLHSACHLSPRLGINALHAGLCVCVLKPVKCY